MANETYLTNVDTSKVSDLLRATEDNSQYFQDVSTNVVAAYTESLDNVMKEVYANVVSVDNPSVETLEKYFLELTNTLYFIGEKAEQVGIYDDLSKAAYKEVYNKAYMDNQVLDGTGRSKPTVNSLTATAESAAIYENVVNSIYNRCYKIIRSKVDAGYEMVRTLSKILSRRTQEQALSGLQPKNNFLNE